MKQGKKTARNRATKKSRNTTRKNVARMTGN